MNFKAEYWKYYKKYERTWLISEKITIYYLLIIPENKN